MYIWLLLQVMVVTMYIMVTVLLNIKCGQYYYLLLLLLLLLLLYKLFIHLTKQIPMNSFSVDVCLTLN